eukprot:CAMPEP_0117002826 /NCGR_PEP_ID=MMETSP0472-20121206/4358_1 /TAXON_ID=693140 ORGANISM="Tiarina fusus, Strain LIS" /NCGR_SAMPLE_ID=MMETSP0472 /ASSEMBLY_ACC=CAM_ASM_000603 /LENGTH=630 /DNA_ID=CAMNT_0004703287 /DNA_START=117 /DNA_END=2010 /DNA_ORIENTATION=-
MSFCRTHCLLGVLLGNLSLIAWALGIQAGYNVFEMSNSNGEGNGDDDHGTVFGLLGYHPNHLDDDYYDSGDDSYYYYLKYTIQQEDLFVDASFRLGRYLYFLLASSVCCKVNGYGFLIVATRGSVCCKVNGYGFPIVATRGRFCPVKRRRNNDVDWHFGAFSWRVYILYDSALCQTVPYSIRLDYVATNATTTAWGGEVERVIYATTATRQESSVTGEDDLNNSSSEEQQHLLGNDVDTNACTPTEGAMALWAASALWLLCGLLVLCCGGGSPCCRNNKSSSTKQTTTSLTAEPLLDPPTRTLGWVAKLIVLTLFATVPYWREAALVAMAPKETPFLSSSTSTSATTMMDVDTSSNANANTNTFPHTQLLGPTMFNPTQAIPYSFEQREWIDPAFEQANFLAWIPFGINLCVALPLVLYGRHRLSHNNNIRSTGGRRHHSYSYSSRRHYRYFQCWPYLMLLLILIQFATAGLCLYIPYSAIWALCPADSKRYPELLYVDLGDGIWQGTDIARHSATMKASCWPTEMGQILAIGGTLLCLCQALLLMQFGLQYSNAQDTLATFAGIEDDYDQQRKKLLSTSTTSLRGDDEEGSSSFSSLKDHRGDDLLYEDEVDTGNDDDEEDEEDDSEYA